MYDLLGRKTGRSDAEMRLWVISQARKRKRYFWTWVNGILLITFIIFALFLTGCTPDAISEAKGSIKDNNPYLIGQSEDGLVLLYRYHRCYIAVHGMSNGISMSCSGL